MSTVLQIALPVLLYTSPSVAESIVAAESAPQGLGADGTLLAGSEAFDESSLLSGSGRDATCRRRSRRSRRSRRQSSRRASPQPSAQPEPEPEPKDEPFPDYTVRKPRERTRPPKLHVTPTLAAWVNGIGAGLWASYEYMPSGFFDGIKDAVDIEAGGILATREAIPAAGAPVRYYAVTAMAGGRWRYGFSQNWDVFVSARAGVAMKSGGHAVGYGFIGTAGAEWKLSEKGRIRMELAYPGAVFAGVSLPFGSPF